MILYPEINPNVLTLGDFSIKWYGVCYLLAFLLGYWQINLKKDNNWNKTQIEDLLFYVAMGVIFGGRIGYIIFYYPSDIITNPATLLQFWLPGRSFHGGLLGVLVAIILYARKHQKSFLIVTDFIVPVIPIGIIFGRIGNFINGELWGRITTVPWGMVFRHVDLSPRHPSQLYELLLEGVLLFLILNKTNNDSKKIGYNSAIFLICYAIFRILVENYREPDIDHGFIIAYLTLGQILSIPMLILGLILYLKSNFNSFNKGKKECGNI